MQSPAEDAGSPPGSEPYPVNNISHVETGAETLFATCAMLAELSASRTGWKRAGLSPEGCEHSSGELAQPPWAEQASLAWVISCSQGQKGHFTTGKQHGRVKPARSPLG